MKLFHIFTYHKNNGGSTSNFEFDDNSINY